MDYNHTFFKFMHDLIDSGLWGKLSATARTLYPVLCRFSNESFKPVYPGTDQLLRLTGFKTKKSLQQAKKELIDVGLIDIIPGNGRSPSRYYFKFSYENSKINIDSYRDTIISLRGVSPSPSGEDSGVGLGGRIVSPNNINININTNNEKQNAIFENIENLLHKFNGSTKESSNHEIKSQIINNMLTKYGDLEVGEAIKIAIERGKNGDIKYLEGILRNRSNAPKYNPEKSDLKRSTEVSKIIEKLSKSYKNIGDSLSYYYKYNNVYFFKTTEAIPIKNIENHARGLGYEIKIITSNIKDSKSNITQLWNNNY